MSTATKTFPLGQIVATANAVDAVPILDIHRALDRHATGDWGELTEEDRSLNDRALVGSEHLLSAYTTDGGTKFWIITEWDRSITTVLLPEDY